MSEYIIEASNLAKLRKAAGLHVKETLELTSGKVVRCRDCANNAHGACKYWDYCDIDGTNGFCAWGERRDA